MATRCGVKQGCCHIHFHSDNHISERALDFLLKAPAGTVESSVMIDGPLAAFQKAHQRNQLLLRLRQGLGWDALTGDPDNVGIAVPVCCQSVCHECCQPALATGARTGNAVQRLQLMQYTSS